MIRKTNTRTCEPETRAENVCQLISNAQSKFQARTMALAIQYLATCTCGSETPRSVSHARHTWMLYCVSILVAPSQSTKPIYANHTSFLGKSLHEPSDLPTYLPTNLIARALLPPQKILLDHKQMPFQGHHVTFVNMRPITLTQCMLLKRFFAPTTNGTQQDC